MLLEITLINYSTTFWVYAAIRLFLSLAFIIGIIYYGAKLRQKTFMTATQQSKSKFVSLGIGWIPRKEERRMTAERRGKQTVYIAGMILTLILTLTVTLRMGMALGYGKRDHELIVSTITYSAVYVQQKINDQKFIMQPQYMRGIESELCSGPPVDWKQGETLKEWTFEQRHGCKRVISYRRYPKGENLDASIQVR